jgi:hypothetical protein
MALTLTCETDEAFRNNKVIPLEHISNQKNNLIYFYNWALQKIPIYPSPYSSLCMK